MQQNQDIPAILYTDGSCHTQQLLGAWVSIILFNKDKMIVSGKAKNTTHNRMELIAVIEGIKYIQKEWPVVKSISVITDSQYVIDLPARKQKMESQAFLTKASRPIQNADLVKQFYDLLNDCTVLFEKIKAHQKKTTEINYNREADMLSRRLVREAIKQASVS